MSTDGALRTRKNACEPGSAPWPVQRGTAPARPPMLSLSRSEERHTASRQPASTDAGMWRRRVQRAPTRVKEPLPVTLHVVDGRLLETPHAARPSLVPILGLPNTLLPVSVHATALDRNQLKLCARGPSTWRTFCAACPLLMKLLRGSRSLMQAAPSATLLGQCERNVANGTAVMCHTGTMTVRWACMMCVHISRTVTANVTSACVGRVCSLGTAAPKAAGVRHAAGLGAGQQP